MDDAIKYMNMLKSKVVHFKKQKAERSRLAERPQEGSLQGTGSQGQRGGRGQCGANASALKCNRKADTSGALKFENLTSELGACEAAFNKSCNTALPAINQTEIDTCSSTIAAFLSLTTPAIAAKREAACKLWVDDGMTAAAVKVKVCDVTTTAVTTINLVI